MPPRSFIPCLLKIFQLDGGGIDCFFNARILRIECEDTLPEGDRFNKVTLSVFGQCALRKVRAAILQSSLEEFLVEGYLQVELLIMRIVLQ
jgi:hypothetical protein